MRTLFQQNNIFTDPMVTGGCDSSIQQLRLNSIQQLYYVKKILAKKFST